MIQIDAISRLGTVLCIGAHSDDIEIGCGGTILRLLDENRNLRVHWVCLSGQGRREAEARKSAELFLQHAAGKEVVIQNFRDGFFPFEGAQVKEFFETLKSVNPDLIFTHARDDLHQDHHLVAGLTWNTFRNHLILEYEIPKYDGDLARPNVFVPLSEATCRKKIDHLMSAFESQSGKQWFTRETFSAILRIRGVEANSPSGFAEAFYGRKLVL